MSTPKLSDFAVDVKENRDEIIAVKFSGCMKNVGELMFKAMKKFKDFESYWLKEYPILKKVLEQSSEEKQFYILSFATGPEFLRLMRGNLGMKNRDEMVVDYDKIMANINPFDGSATNIEIMMRSMVGQAFCQKIYIYDPAFSINTQLYLMRLFDGDTNKVVLYEKSFSDLLREHKEITTIFTDSSTETVEYIQSFPEGDEALKGKSFFISSGPAFDPSVGKNDDGIVFKWQKFFEEVPTRYSAMVNWYQLKYIKEFSNVKNTNTNN